MNQFPQGFDEAKEKAAKEHAEEFAVPYGDHGYKIAFESYHTGADFGYLAGYQAAKEGEWTYVEDGLPDNMKVDAAILDRIHGPVIKEAIYNPEQKRWWNRYGSEELFPYAWRMTKQPTPPPIKAKP